jgi:hypothetical protein
VDRKQRSQAMTGILMITVGLIFLAERLDLAAGLDMSRLWPLFPIVFGIGRVITADDEDRRRHGRFSGLWFVFVGAVFLLHNYGVMPIAQSWPLFIVAGGVSILLGRRAADTSPAQEGKGQS